MKILEMKYLSFESVHNFESLYFTDVVFQHLVVRFKRYSDTRTATVSKSGSPDLGHPDSNMRFGYPNPNLSFGFESKLN